MFGLGPTELIIIAVIVILLFGAKRLPDIGKGLGGAIREFRNVRKEFGSGLTNEEEDGEKPAKKVAHPPGLDEKVVDRVLDQMPGVKKVMEAKKKAETVKKIIR